MTVPVGRPRLKTAFKNARSMGPLYTSGPVAITSDGNKIVTCVSEKILLTEISSGIEICQFASDTTTINSLCVTPSSSHLLVFTASLSLRIFEIPTSTPLQKVVHPTRVISRAHEAPIHICKTDPTSTYLASGSADGVVKVWNIRNGFVTHVFKGHGGIVSALVFDYPQDMSTVTREQKMRLITGSADTRLRIFDLSATSSSANGGKPDVILEGHYSVPRGLDVSLDGKWLVSGGRDSVVLLWDLSSNGAPPSLSRGKGKGKDKAFSPTLVKTIPVLERVEALGILRPDEDLTGSSSGSDVLRFYTGGERGVVRIWDGKDGNALFTLGKEHTNITDDQEEQRQIVDVVYIPSLSSIVSIHADQNIIFHSLSTQSLTQQLIGYNDEIVDATFVSPYFSASAEQKLRDSHLALATNSSLIRVYDTRTFDARLLYGHSDVVLALDQGVTGRLLASGSKDRSARLWAASVPKLNNATTEWGYGCVGICEGHTESIGAIALSRKAGNAGEVDHPQFMFTGSQDRTIKMWDLAGVLLAYADDDEAEPLRCKSLCTHKAHDKDINALDVAPNDRLLVSGSQDRTARIFSIEYIPGFAGNASRGELKLIGTCKGHKRGVWSVRFSRTERILVTGSGDKTVKLWNLDDFSCLKTFEGHANSVLRVDFLNTGLQLVSASSDGLVKLWDIKEEECVATLDNHEDKVWALAISNDERMIVSGAADSVTTFWEDCTEEKDEEKEAARATLVQREQDFQNYLALNDYRKAIQLALAMQQPGRLLSLFRNIQTKDVEPASITGRSSVDDVIQVMGGSDLAKLLQFVKDWNTNAKTSRVAQGVLHAIVKLRSADDLVTAFSDEQREAAFANGEKGPRSGLALKEFVDAFIPYTERHLSRMNKLVQDSYMVDYILGEMDDGTFEDMEVDIAAIL